jgi:hypothetical protein
MKSRRPRAEPFSGTSEFFIVNSPQKLNDRPGAVKLKLVPAKALAHLVLAKFPN